MLVLRDGLDGGVGLRIALASLALGSSEPGFKDWVGFCECCLENLVGGTRLYTSSEREGTTPLVRRCGFRPLPE